MNPLKPKNPVELNDIRDRLTVRKTMCPGDPGTKTLQRKYGDKLYCVRYLYDERTKTRCTTVEIVVEMKPFVRKPRKFKDEDIVQLYLKEEDHDLRRLLPLLDAKWNSENRAWEVRFGLAKELGIESQVGF